MESASREEAPNCGGGEETPRPGPEADNGGDEDDEDMITGPSYDCVFCKRGFTTAQALGGHMNIHRKDRAKAKPPLSSPAVLLPKKPEENFVNSGFCLSILSYKPPNPAAPEEAQIKYQEYILAAAADPMDVDHQKKQQQQQISSVCKEDWRTCLSLQVGPSCGYEYDSTKDIINQKDEKIKEDELDLELRLGHNPS